MPEPLLPVSIRRAVDERVGRSERHAFINAAVLKALEAHE